MFRQLVLARIIEPTSKQDSLRVLEEAGVDAVSYPTLNRRLPAYATDSWRRGLAAACAAHAALGPASLVLYDVSTLYFETDQGAELAHEPSMVIQVLPFTTSDHSGTDGPILVYDFDGAPSVACSECNGGGRIVESADEVGDLMMIVNMIRAAALPRRESASLILRIGSEMADV